MKRELAIERGIPCPGPKGPTGPRTEPSRVAREMKEGESVFDADPKIIDAVRRVIYDLGGKAMLRKRFEKTKEFPDGIWGWRVWRTK